MIANSWKYLKSNLTEYENGFNSTHSTLIERKKEKRKLEMFSEITQGGTTHSSIPV